VNEPTKVGRAKVALIGKPERMGQIRGVVTGRQQAACATQALLHGIVVRRRVQRPLETTQRARPFHPHQRRDLAARRRFRQTVPYPLNNDLLRGRWRDIAGRGCREEDVR